MIPGHNLGAQHDGADADGSNTRNTCNGEAYYVMAAVGGTVTAENLFQNPYKFSRCSSDYFESAITELVERSIAVDKMFFIHSPHSGKWSCLRNEPTDLHFTDTQWTSYMSELPGQKYNIDQQCQQLLGVQSKHCGVCMYVPV